MHSWPSWLPMDALYNTPARRWIQGLLAFEVLLSILKFSTLSATRHNTNEVWFFFLFEEMARAWVLIGIAYATVQPRVNLFAGYEIIIVGAFVCLDVLLVLWFWSEADVGGLYDWMVWMSLEIFLLPIAIFFIRNYGMNDQQFDNMSQKIQQMVYTHLPSTRPAGATTLPI